MKKVTLLLVLFACDTRTVNITAGKHGTAVEVDTDHKAVVGSPGVRVTVTGAGAPQLLYVPLPAVTPYCPLAEKLP